MVELYLQGKLLIRPQSSLDILTAVSSSSKSGELGEGNDEFYITQYLFHTTKGSLTFRELLRYGTAGFTSRAADFYRS